jgi:hypothetical protein
MAIKNRRDLGVFRSRLREMDGISPDSSGVGARIRLLRDERPAQEAKR